MFGVDQVRAWPGRLASAQSIAGAPADAGADTGQWPDSRQPPGIDVCIPLRILGILYQSPRSGSGADQRRVDLGGEDERAWPAVQADSPEMFPCVTCTAVHV